MKKEIQTALNIELVKSFRKLADRDINMCFTTEEEDGIINIQFFVTHQLDLVIIKKQVAMIAVVSFNEGIKEYFVKFSNDIYKEIILMIRGSQL